VKIVVDGTPLCYLPTGIGLYTRALLEALATGYPDWTFIVFAPYPLYAPIPFPNVHVRPSPMRGEPLAGWRAWWFDGLLSGAVARENADYFWAANGLVPFRLRGTPVALTVYDFTPERFPATMGFFPRVYRENNLKRWLGRAAKILPISKFTEREAKSLYGIHSDAVVYPAPDAHFKRQRGERLDGDYLVALGTLEPRKNLESFLTAMDALDSEGLWPRELKLRIVGGKGWRDERMIRMVARMETGGIVERLGYVPRTSLPGILENARALVMPSLYEGFGMPLVEAMAVGCPVVCSDIPVFHEILGTYPALVHGTDVPSICDALRKLVADPAIPPRPDRSVHDFPAFSWPSSAQVFAEALMAGKTAKVSHAE